MKKSPALQRTSGRRRRCDENGNPARSQLSPQEQLFRACMRGDRRQAARALDRGADLSAPVMAVPLKGGRRTQYRPNLLLHAVASAGDVALTALLLSRGADPSRADPAGRTALHVLAAAGRMGAESTGRLTRLLAAAGASAEQTDRDGRSAAHLAAAAGNTAALAALAQLGADCGRADSRGDTPLHAAAQSGSGQATLLALQLSPASLRRRNAAGLAPLALASSPDSARPLLAAGASVDAQTLLALLRQAPDAMPAALDSCVTTNDEPVDSTELQVSVDFAAFCGAAPAAEDRLLAAIVASRQHQLLKHDAVQPFLHAKWCRVRHLFYANLTLCAALTLLVSSYCWARLQRPGGPVETMLAVAVAPLAAAMAAREAFQLVQDPRNYVRSFENWVEVVLLVLTTALLVGPSGDPGAQHGATAAAGNWTSDQAEVGAGHWNGDHTVAAVTWTGTAADRHHWIEHTVAWTLPAAWLQLTLMLGRFPNFGVYINMFVSAAQKLALFVLLLTPLVIGFALGFHVLLSDPSGSGGGPFDSLPISHITTTMMMVGEYNYDDIFLNSGFGASAGLLLTLFIVIMSIMSVNLMIGLTVADTRGVFRAAKLQSLRHTAVQILQVETVLRSALLRALLPARLLRRQQRRVAVLPLLRTPATTSGGGGWPRVERCRFTTERRSEVALQLRPSVLERLPPAERTNTISEISPAVFRPNRQRERRTIYLRDDGDEDAGDGGGVLLASGLETRGWMQRGLLKLLGRRQQQQADRQQKRLLSALMAELSRPHAITDEECTVLSRAAPLPAETSAHPPASATTSSAPAAAPTSIPPPSTAAPIPTAQPSVPVAGQTQAAPGSAPTTDSTERGDGTADPDIVTEGRASHALPPRVPATQRARKTGDHLSPGPDDGTAAAAAPPGAVPPSKPGRAERRQERLRKEALAHQDAAVALSQKLNTVLATVTELSLKLGTVQRRLAASEALSDPVYSSYT